MTLSSAEVMEIDSKVVQSVIFRRVVFLLPGHHGCAAIGKHASATGFIKYS